uniref:Uncharacterized protein n=1 Tax=Erpetoichthys calabaricus TaxID=27687 RepID=A0A8C4RYV2_ERPCA
ELSHQDKKWRKLCVDKWWRNRKQGLLHSVYTHFAIGARSTLEKVRKKPDVSFALSQVQKDELVLENNNIELILNSAALIISSHKYYICICHMK